MHKFTIDIAFRMKKSGPINNIKETFEKESDAYSCYEDWASLANHPASLVESATLIEHMGDVVREHTDKGSWDHGQVTSNLKGGLHAVG